MKHTLAIICLSLILFASCEKKSKAEQLLDDASEEVEKVSEDIKEEGEKASEQTEKDGKELKKKVKKIF